ncbi:MAG: hypothetical protein QXQ57_07235 [Sulfolobales archaeon]
MKTRRACIEILRELHRYIEYMLTKGLRVEYITYDDWRKSTEMIEK